MTCIVAGCGPAYHNISIRLRRPDGTAIWAPNTSAFVCDRHAVLGFTIEIILTPSFNRHIETIVRSPGGQPATRTTPIVQAP